MLIEQRDSLKGEITVPGDKSISHRAIMFGSLAKGVTEIDGFMMGEDCLSTIDCFRKMNVSIEIMQGNKVKVQGNGLFGLKPPTSILNAGKSGTTLRLLLGVLCGQSFNSTITRDETVIRKTVGKVVNPLRKMGANISGREDGNLCPLVITPAPLKGINQNISLTDMHVKSPILVAGLYAEGDTVVAESVKSRDHTELMLNYFGANINIDNLTITSHAINELFAQHVIVPGDISIAAYFLTAGLLVPKTDIVIKNVGVNPTRTGIIDVYKKMGAKIELLNKRTVNNGEKVADIRVTNSNLKAITIEGATISSLMDEVPIIAVAATQAKGTTTIKGLSGFKISENNRLKSLALELSKLGASIQATEDELIIQGGKPLKGTVVESYNDFSITMSLAIAGLIAEEETMIRKAQILDTAFPEFLEVINSL